MNVTKPEQLRRQVENLLKDLNAADLYHSWYMGSQKIWGKQIPGTDVRFFGPKSLLPSENENKEIQNACGITPVVKCVTALAYD